MEPNSSQWCPRTGGGGHKLKHEKFYINIGKNISYSREGVKHWNGLPREAVESPPVQL